MKWLNGKTALITGGASGLGRAVVERFVEEGASVIVLDRNETALSALTDAFPDKVRGVCGDVRSFQDNTRAADLAVSAFGRLDIFIGNAGVWDYSMSLADLPAERIDEAFDEMFSINTKGYLLGAKACLPHLVKSRGCILFTLSNSAFYPGGGGPLYTATKHANLGLIKQLAFELAPYVRVNGIAPGAIPSDLRGARALGQDQLSISTIPLEEYVKRGIPLGRLPKPSEYAGSYVYLASAENSGFATGAIINIDGGIGVRGLASVAGGHDLDSKFQNN